MLVDWHIAVRYSFDSLGAVLENRPNKNVKATFQQSEPTPNVCSSVATCPMPDLGIGLL